MDHGTNASYGRGCHCVECRAAHSAYQTEWARRNPDKVAETRKAGRKKRTPEQIEARRAYMREYVQKNPAQLQKRRDRKWAWRADPENRAMEAAQARAARVRSPERQAAASRKYLLKKLYGLTLAQYDDLASAQGGVCAICQGPPTVGRHRYFHIDHNHETGEVRALLCIRCNTGLGSFQERTDVLLAAVKYLNKHRDRRPAMKGTR